MLNFRKHSIKFLALFFLIFISVYACNPQNNRQNANNKNGSDSFPAIPANPPQKNDEAETGNKPHIIYISLDTLRADHLGIYGYDRPTSPFIDQIAAQGVRFENVISQSPKTAPSHMSIFTGLYPSIHNMHFEFKDGKTSVVPLGNHWETLPQWFKQAGYRTASWNGGGQIVGSGGFSRGFDLFRERSLKRLGPNSMNMVFDWFRENSKQPCFMFIHTYEIHSPYTPPRRYVEKFDPEYKGWIISDDRQINTLARQTQTFPDKVFWRMTDEYLDGYFKIDTGLFDKRDIEHLIALYDAEINYTDELIGTFINRLRNNGLLDNSILIIASDHGEEFMEHGYFLHYKLYGETVRVPLIIYAPGRIPAGVVVKSQVRLIDLAPTILELAGLPISDQIMGESLMPLIKKEGASRPAYSEEPWLYETKHRSFRTDKWALYDMGREGNLLYDLENDPHEKHDISGKNADIVKSLEKQMKHFLRSQLTGKLTPGLDPQQLTPEQREHLRSLGYLK